MYLERNNNKIKDMKRGSWILKIGVVVLLVFGLVGLGTQLLWNWLVPVLFEGPQISFWQAIGLLLLSKILLWPLGKRHHSYRGGSWKPYWKEKWNTMTDEEKMQFRQKMKEKCGWGSFRTVEKPDQS